MLSHYPIIGHDHWLWAEKVASIIFRHISGENNRFFWEDLPQVKKIFPEKLIIFHRRDDFIWISAVSFSTMVLTISWYETTLLKVVINFRLSSQEKNQLSSTTISCVKLYWFHWKKVNQWQNEHLKCLRKENILVHLICLFVRLV